MAQSQELKKAERSALDFDRARLFRSAGVGLLFLGPLAHFYYEFVATDLDEWSIPSKIFFDQTLYLSFYNTVYHIGLSLFAGKSLGASVNEYSKKFVLLLTSGWKLWPLVGIVTYTLIPQQNRVLWIDMIEIVYCAILSSIANEGDVE